MLQTYYDKNEIEAGCDEAGRGCLAGPVFAAAVILPTDFENKLLKDSKLLSEKKRLYLREIIQEEALAWAVGSANEAEIDQINIAQASYLAMHRAVEQLPIQPTFLLIDGKYFKSRTSIPHRCIIKGDNKFAAIAAASILAKTYRDEWMQQLAEEYPFYDWQQNKGYPTKAHRRAIAQNGITPYHRRSFKLLDNQAVLF